MQDKFQLKLVFFIFFVKLSDLFFGKIMIFKRFIFIILLSLIPGLSFAQNRNPFRVTTVQSACYILGDSIAQGISTYRNDCGSATQVGLNTDDARKIFTSQGRLHFGELIISLGINDQYRTDKDIHQAWYNLITIRKNIDAQQVIWILPNTHYAYQNELVKQIATAFGDSYVDVSTYIGRDNIHPTLDGYRNIAYGLKMIQTH